MRMSRQSWFAVTVLSSTVVVSTPGAGCNLQAPPDKTTADNKDQAKKAPAEPLPSSVQMTFTHKIDSPGEIQADEQTRIFAKITGYAKKVHKDIGDPIKPGDPLVDLAVPELDEELKQKQALETQAKAELSRAEKWYNAALANVKVAEAKLKEAT